MTLHPIDYIIIAISLIIPIYISIRLAKKQTDTGNYFKGGGNIPAWAVGMSILATLISSVTFLAYPGSGYSSNWILLVQGLMVPITLIFFIKFVVPLYRKVIGLSAYEYFEKRFGFGARLYTSLAFFLAHFSKMGTVFYLIALAFSEMTGMGTVNMIWLLGAMIILITLLGGMEAVIWMDVIQGFILIGGGLITLGIIIFSTTGGLPAIYDVANDAGHVGFGPYDFDLTSLTFFVMAINGVFYAIQKYGTDQTIVQRYLTAKSDKDAVKASLIGVLMSVPVWALFMFIGTALFGYYQISGAPILDGTKADAVFPFFIMTELPIGVVGLVLAGLLAAAISSLDSDLNCLSAIFMEDYYLRFRPNTDAKKQLFLSKLIVVIAGIASILVALYYVDQGGKGVLKTVFKLYAIFSGGIAGLFLLGIVSNRANRMGTYMGIIASVLFTAYAVITSTPLTIGGEDRLLIDLGDWNFTHHKYMLGVYSHLILFVVGYVASYFFKEPAKVEGLTYKSWKQLQN
ncbi:sodium:solute symporter [Marinoscillum sp. MHG1-6]|uniref:sodium:solute symporter n=1 Tax=Marinoscillum sp. MHG1-6 TaxID=2959627 RepID=UPI00215849E4|nr:sodium:solute symporter [Marinoscillum sp. MHG1-6]